MTSLDSEKLRAKGLSRYQIRGRLGKGGSGVVYDAYDLKFKREVALKIIENTQGQNFVATAQDEAICAAKILHPNVIQIYDFGVTDDGSLVYISMEKVDGFPLKDVLDAVTYLTVPEGIAVGIRLCSAMQAMHQLGIVHRDIKPANIMIRPGMHVTLLDFGIAKFKKPSHDTTGRLVLQGTPLYMSPETCRGGPTTALSDIYALGVVLYALFLGTHFIYRNNPNADYEDILRAHLIVDPNPLCELIPGFPAQLSNIVARAMAKDPAVRWPSALEMGQALIKYEKEFAEECRVQRLTPTLRDLVALTRAKNSVPRNPSSAVERITVRRLPDSVPNQLASANVDPLHDDASKRLLIASAPSPAAPLAVMASRATIPNAPEARRRAGLPLPARLPEPEPDSEPRARTRPPAEDEPAASSPGSERVVVWEASEVAPSSSFLERLDAIPLGRFVQSAVVLSVLIAVPMGVLIGRTSAAKNHPAATAGARTTTAEAAQQASAPEASQLSASVPTLPELTTPEPSTQAEEGTLTESSRAQQLLPRSPTPKATPARSVTRPNLPTAKRTASPAADLFSVSSGITDLGADTAAPKPIAAKGPPAKAPDASPTLPVTRHSIY